MAQLNNRDEKHRRELAAKESRLEDFIREHEDMKRQFKVAKEEIEKKDDRMKKCIHVTKQLLIEKSLMEKKQARQKCMQDRLRLGQFVTQRQGASFAESWVDGSAFTDLLKKQEIIASARDDIEKMRKALIKKKPPSGNTGKSKSQNNSGINNGSDNSNSEFIKPELTVSTGSSGGGSGSGGLSGSNSNSATSKAERETLQSYEYYEQDEILKLRSQALKKEDCDIQLELEKLERERNLHIRELKRIHNEDQSSFNNHITLNDRYLLLMLLGKGLFFFVDCLFFYQEF